MASVIAEAIFFACYGVPFLEWSFDNSNFLLESGDFMPEASYVGRILDGMTLISSRTGRDCITRDHVPTYGPYGASVAWIFVIRPET